MDIPGVFWFQRWCLVYGTAWYHDVPRNSDERCLILGTNVLLVIFIHLVLGSRFSDSSKFINYICIYVLYIYITFIYIYTVYVPLIGWVMFDWGPCLYFLRIRNHASGSDLRPPVRLLQFACVWLIKLPCLERVHSSYHVKVVSAVSLICSGKIWVCLKIVYP